jgi:hypothetical protein
MSAPPRQPPPRYLPARALPAHAYVPGRSLTPRPAAERDPDATALPEAPDATALPEAPSAAALPEAPSAAALPEAPGRSLTPRPAAERDPRAAALPEALDVPSSSDDAPGDWRRHPVFLWGLDLYNHGYPWEAHEAWESLWVRAPHGSAVRDMLQALIQCAAAVVHARAGRAAGQARLAGRALGRLTAVRARAGSRCLGIDIDGLARAVRAYGDSGGAEGWPVIALAPEASLPEPARGAGGVSG